jgi:hypothetical protein
MSRLTGTLQEAADAHVDAEGEPAHAAVLAALDGLLHEQRRQVVDAKELEVLQGAQGRRTPSPAQARDDHDLGWRSIHADRLARRTAPRRTG